MQENKKRYFFPSFCLSIGYDAYFFFSLNKLFCMIDIPIKIGRSNCVCLRPLRSLSATGAISALNVFSSHTKKSFFSSRSNNSEQVSLSYMDCNVFEERKRFLAVVVEAVLALLVLLLLLLLSCLLCSFYFEYVFFKKIKYIILN